MKQKNLFIAIGLIIFLFFLFFIQYKDERDLEINKKMTKGKIIKLSRKYQARYGLVYEYYVKNIRYTGNVGISPFICDDGTKNCIGQEFPVYYSSKNPENSRIDLGNYEKYKTTVEFVK